MRGADGPVSENGVDMVLTSLDGQTGLPRYFGQVFRMAQVINSGRLDLALPDGRIFRVEGAAPGPVCRIDVHDPDIFARTVREGYLGFCDAYLEGGWSTPDLQATMDFFHADNDEIYDALPGQALVQLYERLRFWLQGNSRRQAKKNISHHYDLGNDFYGLWLDDTMTYSSAIFESGQESLESAQRRKYESIVNDMGAQPGDHVLEIGCGWGGFAEYAAGERGLKVTGLTISQEQHDFAVARMARAGLSDKVEIKLQDYRAERGTYDGIASIEMFEAVGERYWPVYYQTLNRCLKPGARATLQIITVADKRWEIYRKSVDFIQKYIFPGGMLPSPTVLKEGLSANGLQVVGHHEFAASYALTLKRWYETFSDRWDDISPLGFDERFRRMWAFYLTSCASAFDRGHCDVTQITVTRPA